MPLDVVLEPRVHFFAPLCTQPHIPFSKVQSPFVAFAVGAFVVGAAAESRSRARSRAGMGGGHWTGAGGGRREVGNILQGSLPDETSSWKFFWQGVVVLSRSFTSKFVVDRSLMQISPLQISLFLATSGPTGANGNWRTAADAKLANCKSGVDPREVVRTNLPYRSDFGGVTGRKPVDKCSPRHALPNAGMRAALR